MNQTWAFFSLTTTTIVICLSLAPIQKSSGAYLLTPGQFYWSWQKSMKIRGGSPNAKRPPGKGGSSRSSKNRKPPPHRKSNNPNTDFETEASARLATKLGMMASAAGYDETETGIGPETDRPEVMTSIKQDGGGERSQRLSPPKATAYYLLSLPRIPGRKHPPFMDLLRVVETGRDSKKRTGDGQYSLLGSSYSSKSRNAGRGGGGGLDDDDNDEDDEDDDRFYNSKGIWSTTKAKTKSSDNRGSRRLQKLVTKILDRKTSASSSSSSSSRSSSSSNNRHRSKDRLIFGPWRGKRSVTSLDYDDEEDERPSSNDNDSDNNNNKSGNSTLTRESKSKSKSMSKHYGNGNSKTPKNGRVVSGSGGGGRVGEGSSIIFGKEPMILFQIWKQEIISRNEIKNKNTDSNYRNEVMDIPTSVYRKYSRKKPEGKEGGNNDNNSTRDEDEFENVYNNNDSDSQLNTETLLSRLGNIVGEFDTHNRSEIQVLKIEMNKVLGSKSGESESVSVSESESKLKLNESDFKVEEIRDTKDKTTTTILKVDGDKSDTNDNIITLKVKDKQNVDRNSQSSKPRRNLKLKKNRNKSGKYHFGLFQKDFIKKKKQKQMETKLQLEREKTWRRFSKGFKSHDRTSSSFHVLFHYPKRFVSSLEANITTRIHLLDPRTSISKNLKHNKFYLQFQLQDQRTPKTQSKVRPYSNQHNRRVESPDLENPVSTIWINKATNYSKHKSFQKTPIRIVTSNSKNIRV